MITFITLFLGLTWGPQTIEVLAPGPAARVVLLLDGTEVASDAEPPWRLTCDLGEEPAPRLLEAVAYDAEGGELGRARRAVNLAMPRAEAGMVLERDDDGRAEAVRLAWQSVSDAEPSAVEVLFDGEPLTVTDPRRVALPDHDAGALHVVSAELTFTGGARARADLAFGGAFGAAISTENTAVAVRTDAGRALRSREDAAGLLTVGGESLPVLAVEHERADLVFVVERSSGDVLKSLNLDLLLSGDTAPVRSTASTETYRLPPSGTPRGSRASVPTTRASSSRSRGGLLGGDRMFLVLPVAAPAGATPYDLFPVSQTFTAEDGGSAWVLTAHRFLDDGRPGQHLARAVAVAGIHAASGKRPRAVVLVLGPAPDEASPFPPAVARRLLARLRVPLVVWYVEKGWKAMRGEEREAFWKGQGDLPRNARVAARELDEARARRRDLAAGGWGPVRDIDSVEALTEEARRLREEVEDQRVLWVDGLHLPGDVALADGWAGVELLE